MTMGKRGSVMIHVLVTSVIMGLLAAGMVSIVMMQYRMEHRSAQGSQGASNDELALSLVISYWNLNNSNCTAFTTPAVPGPAIAYTCGGGAVINTCSCNCTTVTANFPVIQAINGPPCRLTIVSSNSVIK
ncbi:MAG: hypothetical protein HY927_11280 [Elusimicrobia bacterium]|nr:hypothetical protein [Elusimicrobiota bacterium]